MKGGLILGLLAAALFSGCTGYSNEWKRAAAAGNYQEGSDPSGPWQGTWRSEANGHSGKLKALVSPIPGTPNSYRAHYQAKYKRILSFSYTAQLQVTPSNGVYHFSGSADLGKLAGGVYHYSGYSTATNFYSTYKSKKDHGVFEMRRPEQREK